MPSSWLENSNSSAWAFNFKQYVIARLRTAARAERPPDGIVCRSGNVEEAPPEVDNGQATASQGPMSETSMGDWKLCSPSSQQNSSCQKFSPGDWILYWRRQKGGNRGCGERGRWYGPAQVVCGDDKVVRVSHCGQLIRAAPEQLCSASLREWQAIQGQTIRERNVSEVGAATKQVVDLIGQRVLPSRDEVEEQGDLPENQPDPPEVVPPDGNLNVVREVDADGDQIMREAPQTPSENMQVDQPEHEISPAVSLDLEEPVDPSQVPLPDDGDEEDMLFGDTECFLPHASDKQELQIHSTEVPEGQLPSPQQAVHFVMLASEERKKRVEVRLRDLNPSDRALFEGTKGKEVSAWIDHHTVQKVAAGTLDDSQIMRCRWILIWKGPKKGRRTTTAQSEAYGFGLRGPRVCGRT